MTRTGWFCLGVCVGFYGPLLDWACRRAWKRVRRG